MTKLLVLALCVCLGMSMSVKERLEKSETLNGSAESIWGAATCTPEMIGNGICQFVCDDEAYNFDGGDCCPSSWMNDGYCDGACNFEQHQWDGGDCPH